MKKTLLLWGKERSLNTCSVFKILVIVLGAMLILFGLPFLPYGFILIFIGLFCFFQANKLEKRIAEVKKQPEINQLSMCQEISSFQSKPQELSVPEFSFQQATNVYFGTNHCSCPSSYDYRSYFELAFKCLIENIPNHNIILSSEKVLRNKEINNPIEDTKNITAKSNISKLGNFIAIDTETTGLKTGENDIIEICAIKFVGFIPTEKFHTYLKPRKLIPPDATIVNGITDDMVKDSPTFSQIKDDLQMFIDGFSLVAHNAKFDMNFLYVSGLDLEHHTNKIYDTLKLARLKIKDSDGSKLDSYKLSDLCEERNIVCNNFHSADSDTLACAILYVDIIKEIFDVDNIYKLVNNQN